ncbi:MAG TPA: DUF1553 domain-containing protein, partial [Verrucomicrobiae bacterium]|nr:DUF1553 domain-containing protein [Verrucomicrobiae bacterium]
VTAYLKAGENKILLKINNGGGGSGFYFKLLTDPVKEHPVEFAAATQEYTGHEDKAKGALDDKATTGWSVGDDDNAAKPHQAFFRAEYPFGFQEGTDLKVKLQFESPTPGQTLGRFRVAVTTADGLSEFFEPPDAVRAALIPDDADRSAGQKMELQKYYRRTFVPEIKQWTKTLDEQRKARNDYRDAIPVSMVMQESEKTRDTFLLVRGDYNNHGDRVKPGVPQHLMPLPEGMPENRLGLAKWLTHPDHPLTSRVTVNHFWQQYFGAGIVKTAEDFGSQGEWPSHPELLDWLATEFIQSGWNVKAMQRLIVTSATYRQSAAVPKEALQHDPDNRLLSHFPRLRLEAEAIRDNALSISGLLKPRIGGPSVYPYQPPGLWAQVAFEGTREWEQTPGDDSYRRGLYTYWRRSIPYPSLITFDAPTRETCTVRRPRTNTPLQALVLMNDPVYVEASRGLGFRIMKNGGKTLRDKVNYAFKLCVARPPSDREQRLLASAYTRELQRMTTDRVAASKLVNVGSKPPVDIDICELAAWTAVGNILLNLDEVINKG